MKKIVVLVLIILLIGCGKVVKFTEDLPEKQTYSIDNIQNTDKSILFIGDSLAWNMARDGKYYATAMNIINRGRPGESSNFIKNIWASEVLAYKWKAIVVTCGTNDVGHDSIDFVTQNIEYMIKTSSEIGNRLIVCTLPPRSGNNSKTKIINNYIKASGVEVLDNESLWCTANSSGIIDFIPENTYDGVHPTVTASNISMDALKIIIEKK